MQLVFLLLGVAALTTSSPNRQPKIFDANFWNGFEKGLRDTSRVMSRVSENIEMAMDQLTNDFTHGFRERSSGPFEEDYPGMQPEASGHIEAISGNIGGVDDGLKVYYTDENGDKMSTQVDEVAETDASASPFSPFNDHHFGFNFGGSLFRPFGPVGHGAESHGPKNFFDILQNRRQWWKGPNVCTDREEVDENEATEVQKNEGKSELPPAHGSVFGFGHISLSSCKEEANSYSCTTKTSQRGVAKSVKVTYRCCHGFARDSTGCMRVELSDLPKAIDGVDGSDFLTLLRAADLEQMLLENNLTLFVPTDEAIQEYTQDLEEMNELQNNIDGYRSLNQVIESDDSHSLRPALLSHITDGFVYAAQFVDEQVLPTKNAQSTLRVNTYSNFPPTVTINCARVVTANQHATNGVIHSIDRVLSPVQKTISQLLSSDPKFSIFAQLLNESGLMDVIEMSAQQTVFAPTNEAFNQLSNSTLEGILKGNTCQEAILLSHLLPNTICSAAIHDEARTVNRLNKFLNLNRDENDDLFVAKAKIIERDIVGTNGVIQVINGVLVPIEAKPAMEILNHHNVTKFMDLIDLAEMRDQIDAMNGVTIFAPTNQAMEKVSPQVLDSIKADKKKLRELLAYHITTSSMRSQDMINNHVTNTQADIPLRINLNTRIPLISDIMQNSGRAPFRMAAGCSRVSLSDTRGCGVVVHLVEEMLQLPSESVYQQLQSQKELSLFAKMVEELDLENDLARAGPYTILAPSDHALKTMPEEELNQIMSDKKMMEKLVKKHILYEHLCCSGINHNSWLFMDRKRAMDSSLVHVRRSHTGRLMAGPARIIECGRAAENGVVHTISRLLSEVNPQPNPINAQRRLPALGLKFLGF